MGQVQHISNDRDYRSARWDGRETCQSSAETLYFLYTDMSSEHGPLFSVMIVPLF